MHPLDVLSRIILEKLLLMIVAWDLAHCVPPWKAVSLQSLLSQSCFKSSFSTKERRPRIVTKIRQVFCEMIEAMLAVETKSINQ